MNMDNYAPGTAYDSLAPWNEKEDDYETIKVALTLTLIKDVEIDVKKDLLPLDNEDLKHIVRKQIILPHELSKTIILPKNPHSDVYHFIKDSVLRPCKGWEEADLEVEEI